MLCNKDWLVVSVNECDCLVILLLCCIITLFVFNQFMYFWFCILTDLIDVIFAQ